MNMKKALIPALVFLASLMQGCGQNGAAGTAGTTETGSFAAAASSESTAAKEETAKNQIPDEKKSIGESVPEDIAENSGESAKTATNQTVPAPEVSTPESSEPAESDKQAAAAKEKKPASENPSEEQEAQPGEGTLVKQEKQVADANPKKDTSLEGKKESEAEAPPAPPKEAPSKKTALSAGKQAANAKSGPTSIGWGEFFDGDDQTTPSERFWDLSGSTVTIKGFMGEVLSFDKNWFLLIPEPGAECPFDNGDETYWNKIMIVFVPDDVNLRYKSEALEITGRLDVGIKIDESGYKTMFRLYDASFKEIKE